MDDPAAVAEPNPPRRRADLTTGPIARSLVLFALPALGANILQALNASVNAVWVGRFLGSDALAATSNANLIMLLMLAGVFGFGIIASIMVGQNMGRGDIEAVRRVTGTALGTLSIGSIVIAGAGYLATPAMLHLLATPAEAYPFAEAYLRMIFVGLPGTFLMTMLTMCLRGVGDALTPFLVMILNVALDSGLNPVLILGIGPAPALGIAGSSAATTIAAYVSLIVLMIVVYVRDLALRLRGLELRWLIPDPALLRVIVVKGIPTCLQMFVTSGAGLALIGIVNHSGVSAVAAYGVDLQLWSYVQMPSIALGMAVSAMAAQNIGAGLWSRVESITRCGVVANLITSATLVLLITTLDQPIMRLFFGGESFALPLARHINFVAGWSFVVFGVAIVLFGAVRASGAVYAPLVILAISLFPVRLGFILAARPLIGDEALWWSVPAGSITAVAMAVRYYRSDSWRHASLANSRGSRAVS